MNPSADSKSIEDPLDPWRLQSSFCNGTLAPNTKLDTARTTNGVDLDIADSNEASTQQLPADFGVLLEPMSTPARMQKHVQGEWLEENVPLSDSDSLGDGRNHIDGRNSMGSSTQERSRSAGIGGWGSDAPLDPAEVPGLKGVYDQEQAWFENQGGFGAQRLGPPQERSPNDEQQKKWFQRRRRVLRMIDQAFMMSGTTSTGSSTTTTTSTFSTTNRAAATVNAAATPPHAGVFSPESSSSNDNDHLRSQYSFVESLTPPEDGVARRSNSRGPNGRHHNGTAHLRATFGAALEKVHFLIFSYEPASVSTIHALG